MKLAAWEALKLRTCGGDYVVPARLEDVHTFVFLEQEQWFEKEWQFLCRWAQPGHRVIDAVADIGHYAIALALAIGPEGRVYAFESRPDRRSYLKASIELNGLNNVAVSESTLSSQAGMARLVRDEFGDLQLYPGAQALEAEADYEVRTTTCDGEIARSVDMVDLVRLDKWSAAEPIVTGGRKFFFEQSPLVMFSIKRGTETRNDLRQVFRQMGYAIYRLLGDASYLVPVGDEEQAGEFELSLFAAKPESQAILGDRGLLAERLAADGPLRGTREQAIQNFLSLPYAMAWGITLEDLECSITGQATAYYALHYDAGQAPAVRWGSLMAAYDTLRVGRGDGTLPWLMTYARVAHDVGRRKEAIEALMAALEMLDRAKQGAAIEIDEPFLPPLGRYDQIDAGEDPGGWVRAAILEGFEKYRAWSSCFAPYGVERIVEQCELPFLSPEIWRRTLLQRLRNHEPIALVPQALDRKHVHLNPEYWTGPGYEMLRASQAALPDSDPLRGQSEEASPSIVPIKSAAARLDARAADISSRLRGLAGRKEIAYSFVPLLNFMGIRYYPERLVDECSALSGFRYVPYESGEHIDVLLTASHGADDSAVLDAARSRLRADGLIGVWLWDNHTSKKSNLRSALAADFVFPSHRYAAGYLRNPASLLAAHIPACSAQWTRNEVAAWFDQILTTERSSKVLVNYVDYEWSPRSPILRRLQAELPEAEVLLMSPWNRGRYFDQTAEQRFAEWCGYKTTVILPLRNDFSTRLFDALLAGLVPVVPQSVLDLDSVIPPEIQDRLGIVRVASLDIPVLREAFRLAIDRFDANGEAGARQRHEFVLDGHMLRHRVAAMLQSLLHYVRSGIAAPDFMFPADATAADTFMSA